MTFHRNFVGVIASRGDETTKLMSKNHTEEELTFWQILVPVRRESRRESKREFTAVRGIFRLESSGVLL